MYSAIANGGTIWKPTVAKAIVSKDGKVLKKFQSERLGDIGVTPEMITFLHDSLYEVTLSGTSAGVFAGFPVATSGKTGTAQVFGKNPNGRLKDDSAWYAAMAPTANPRYVAVMMVSQGGFGASTSGLGVRKIYETLFGVKGRTVDQAAVLFPSGKPPTKLPKISPATRPAGEKKP
jgi:penicillin-binding protein 2